MGHTGRMPILDKLTAPITRAVTSSMPLASPWQSAHPHHLESIVYNDIFGTARRHVSRKEAVQIPALSRARLLITSTIPRLPLKATYVDTGEPADVPYWLTHSRGTVTPFHRMLWTVDDLFFYGWSLWSLERDPVSGDITSAARIPYDRWGFDDNGNIKVDDKPVWDDDVMLIPGVSEGILTYGAATLAEAIHLANAVQKAAETPSAHTELHQTNDAPMTEDEVRALINSWAAARRGENGGVAFTSAGIEVREHGAPSEHLLINARNAVSVDVARHAGIPASMVDAYLSGSSISYANTSARMAELITFGLSPLMNSVTARLSQDDITPHGVAIEYDTTTVVDQLRPFDRRQPEDNNMEETNNE